MRVNKDEATQFIDVKIAQFKELETALGEGTFSLEKYLSVYKETYIIISRLFSEKEWEEFNREVGFRPGSPYIVQCFSPLLKSLGERAEDEKQFRLAGGGTQRVLVTGCSYIYCLRSLWV